MSAERTEKVDFTDVKWTMLVTLYQRAMDSRTKGSILRDHAAAEAIDRIDYNFGRWTTRATSGDRYTVVLRARQLDEWATDFLSKHPDATVLQLGCGLDSRAFRLDLPGDVRWFDVDLPDVIELRRKLYSEHDGYRMLASSVTEPDWLDQVPADRATLIIAEGLLMYLAPREVEQLLQRLTDRFAADPGRGGELLFDGVSPWVVWTTKLLRGPFAGFRMSWSIGDGRELERLNPRLRHVMTVSPPTRYAEIPVRSFRVLYRIACKVPAYRDALRLFRFEF
jgi:O-methyltransferase involved in polyketide biosynthesis